MHGAKSGNLMIYYNDKIITVDFKVFEGRSYKFFIDEELCEISVHKHKKTGKYKYEFSFDHKTKTDYNIRRNKKIKKSNRLGIAMVIGVPLLITLLIFGYTDVRKRFLEKQLKKHPAEDWATVRVYMKDGSKVYNHHYFFPNKKPNGGANIKSSKSQTLNAPTTPHGLPLVNGDIFKVSYAANYNFYSKIDYNQPNDATAIKMMQRVARRHLEYHDQIEKKENLLCEVQTAFEIEGMDGLAKIYHQQMEKKQNPRYNVNSYLRMIRDSPFKKAYEVCWTGE